MSTRLERHLTGRCKQQADVLKRFAWLCDELRVGNQFSDETLLRWAREARAAMFTLKRDAA